MSHTDKATITRANRTTRTALRRTLTATATAAAAAVILTPGAAFAASGGQADHGDFGTRSGSGGYSGSGTQSGSGGQGGSGHGGPDGPGRHDGPGGHGGSGGHGGHSGPGGHGRHDGPGGHGGHGGPGRHDGPGGHGGHDGPGVDPGIDPGTGLAAAAGKGGSGGHGKAAPKPKPKPVSGPVATTTKVGLPKVPTAAKAMTLSAHVSPVHRGAPGTPAETGTVTFTIDGTAGTPIPVMASKAAEKVKRGAGKHLIDAKYSGDQGHAGSDSGPITVTVA